MLSSSATRIGATRRSSPLRSSVQGRFAAPSLAFEPSGTQVRHINLQEYDSKSLLEEFGVNVQQFKVASTVDEALQGAKELKAKGVDEIVVKAQILAGGRGKGTFDNGFQGGVHLSREPDEIAKLSEQMLGHKLSTKQTAQGGVLVEKLMLAEAIDLDKEMYFAILLDRETNGPVIVASSEGGVDIEETAETNPDAIVKEPIDIFKGIQPEQTERVAKALGFSGDSIVKAQKQIEGLYNLFVAKDCTQVEINPLALTPSGDVFCVDAKLGFDDSAEFRQKNVFALRDTKEEDPREVAASEVGLNYIGMDGNIGCMVNGAGLAMATMDIIKLYDGEPANFLDVGGGATAKQVTQAFKIITSDKQVQALLVNIFGGIMRCDVIAEGIIEAAKEVSLSIPLVVRLEGTNVERGKQLLQDSGLPIITASDLDDAAQKAVAAIQ